MPRIYTKNCKNCNILSRSTSEFFCSQQCYFLALKSGVTVAGFKKGHKRFGNGALGKHWKLSDETKKRQGAWIRKLGKKLSVDARIKMSLARKGKRMGVQNNWWKGGKTELGLMIRTSSQYNEWRLKVYQRDNFTCQECGECGVPLNADHIKRLSEIIAEFLKTTNLIDHPRFLLALKYKPFWDINNGRTLCVPCHRKTPTYGRRKSINLSL